jgi:hypothetical protein
MGEKCSDKLCLGYAVQQPEAVQYAPNSTQQASASGLEASVTLIRYLG